MAILRTEADGLPKAMLRAASELANDTAKGALLTKRALERVAAAISGAIARKDASGLAALAYAVGQVARRDADAHACVASSLLRDLARVRPLAPVSARSRVALIASAGDGGLCLQRKRTLGVGGGP